MTLEQGVCARTGGRARGVTVTLTSVTRWQWYRSVRTRTPIASTFMVATDVSARLGIGKMKMEIVKVRSVENYEKCLKPYSQKHYW